MEYYSAIQRNTILIPSTLWLNLENVMLNAISQTRKANIVCPHLYNVPRIGKFIKTESRIGDWGCQGLGEGGIGS